MTKVPTTNCIYIYIWNPNCLYWVSLITQMQNTYRSRRIAVWWSQKRSMKRLTCYRDWVTKTRKGTRRHDTCQEKTWLEPRRFFGGRWIDTGHRRCLVLESKLHVRMVINNFVSPSLPQLYTHTHIYIHQTRGQSLTLILSEIRLEGSLTLILWARLWSMIAQIKSMLINIDAHNASCYIHTATYKPLHESMRTMLQCT